MKLLSAAFHLLLAAAGPAAAHAAQPQDNPHPTVKLFSSNVYQNIYGIAVSIQGVVVTGSTGLLRDANGDESTGVIGHIKLNGGPVETIYSKLNYYAGSNRVAPLGIDMDKSGNLLWADPDALHNEHSALFTGTLNGTSVQLAYGGLRAPRTFPVTIVGAMVEENKIFFSDAGSGGVGEIAAGGTVSQIGPDRYPAASANNMWSQMGGRGKKSVFLADSGMDIAVREGKQALIERTEILPAIRAIDLNHPGVYRTITTRLKHPHGIVQVGTHLLFVTTAHAIWRINLRDANKVRLFVTSDQFINLQGICARYRSLYVADDGNTYGPSKDGVSLATNDAPGVIWKVTGDLR